MLDDHVAALTRNRIRSFSRRGRITSAQQQALQRLWNRYGLDASISFHDQIHFPKPAPLILEIGFGNGESLIQYAKIYPEKNFIGIETYPPGIGHLLLLLENLDIKNVRVYREDAVDILEKCFFDNALSGIKLFFPDPWPKKRHHKRRLVNVDFVSLVGAKLMAGGFFYSATDCDDYALKIQEIVKASGHFIDASSNPKFIDLVKAKPQTKFGRKAIQEGRLIRNLIFEQL